MLIVVPEDNPVQKRTLLAVARLLAAEGHQVRVIPAEEVCRKRAYVQRSPDLE